MRYKHIFWDWNGTLLDDSWLSTKVVSNMLEKRALGNISLVDYKNKFGFPIIDFYKEMNFDFENESYEDIGHEFIHNYNAQRHECNLHVGAFELIEELYYLGLEQSIVSAAQVDALRDVVAEKGLTGFMHSIIGLDDIFAKSKVSIAKNHFLSLGLSPKDVLFVGDTHHDSHAAQEIGCDCVYVSKGHCSHERLESTNTHRVFADHSELKGFIKGDEADRV